MMVFAKENGFLCNNLHLYEIIDKFVIHLSQPPFAPLVSIPSIFLSFFPYFCFLFPHLISAPPSVLLCIFISFFLSLSL